MITLAVAVVLLVIAVPSFQTFTANNRLASQANDVIADLNFARSEAVRRGTRITVCKSSNPTAASPTCDTNTSNPWTSGRVIFVDGGVAGTIETSAPPDEILRVKQTLDGASSGNRLLGDSNNGAPVRISFAASGMTESLSTLVVLGATDTEAQLRLCDNRGASYGRAIVITITGRSRVAAVGKNKTGGALSCT